MRRKSFAAAIAFAAVFTANHARAEDDAACKASYVEGQRRYKLAHDFIGGRAELLVCAKTCPDELRESCGRWLQEIDREVPSIVVKAKDGRGHDVVDVSLALDGAPIAGYVEGTPIDLNPGPHTLRVARAGHLAKDESFVVNAGEKLRVVEVWTEPKVEDVFVTRTRRPIPAATYAFLGVGAVAAASFGIFASWSTIEYSKTSSCTPSCAQTSRDSGFEAKTIVADVSLGVAVAALAGAGVFYLTRPTVTERYPKPAAAWVAPAPGGASFGVRF